MIYYPSSKILFVCTGNICRSPTAHGVLEHMAKKAGVEVTVDSAGTFDFHVGQPPDPRTIEAARKRGYDLSAQRARTVTQEDFAEFDLILAMDKGHMKELEAMCPMEHWHKLSLYLDYAQGDDAEVPDPYYGGPKRFEHVLNLVETASTLLLRKIKSKG